MNRRSVWLTFWGLEVSASKMRRGSWNISALRRQRRGPIDGDGGGVVDQLRRVDFGVNLAGLEQFLVPAAGDDGGVVQHQDLIGVENGADALGDDKARPALHQPHQGLLDAPLRLEIDAGSRVVQNEDARIEQQGAG